MDFSLFSKSTFLFFFLNIEMNALTSHSLGVGGRICVKSISESLMRLFCNEMQKIKKNGVNQ